MKPPDELFGGATIDVALWGRVVARIPVTWFVRARFVGDLRHNTGAIEMRPTLLGHLLGASASIHRMAARHERN